MKNVDFKKEVPLPHMVGTADIANAELKKLAMQFMENFRSLHAQLREARLAIADLQRRKT